ncbi:MAG: hypothetical protein A2097_02720 [Desulfobacula sp. GWF2_41_7]|nr:MAG: hypothetical protein A2097_02720 [Desulfobacula sp. GWF2_41_7]
MSNLLSVGLIILMVCIYFSRSISKEALELLSEQEKLLLYKQFSGSGRFYLIPVIIGFTGYITITYLKPAFSNAAFVILILFFLFFLFFISIRVIRKMKAFGFPAGYIKEYQQSRWIYNIGFTLCGGILLYELLK